MERPRLPLIVAGAAAVAAAAITIIALRRQREVNGPTPTVPAAPTDAAQVTTEQRPTAAALPSPDVPPPAQPDGAAKADASEQQEQARRAKERGNKRFAGKQYAQAIAEYTNAIALSLDEEDPEVAKFYGNRAQCNACLEQHAEAESDCDAALKIDPKYVKALVRRAMAREKLGKNDQALVDFTGALLLSNMQHEAASTGIDRLIKEIAAANAAIRLQEPMHCLPSPYFIATFIDSFKAHRERLSRTRPPIAELSKSIAGARTGVERAKFLTERALAHMQARSYELSMLDWADAVSLISPLGDGFSKGSESPPSQAERESTLKAWGESKDAPASSGLALGMLGMFFHLRHNYDKAMACYDRALELDNCVEVLLKRSSLWFEKEELPKAFGDFDTAIALQPKHPDIYCHRGQLHMLQQDMQKAVDDLKKSVRLDGGSVLARIQLGMAHHRLKQTTDAKTVFMETEARFPTSPDALNYYGEFLIDSGDLEGAKAKFEKALEVSGGGFALAHVNLGVIKLHAEQDADGAILQCDQAIAADPLCETAHIHLAHLMLQKPDLARAVSAFDDAVALIRVKQELEETFAMREAAAAQLALVTEQPDIFKPVLEQQHREMKERIAQYQASQM